MKDYSKPMSFSNDVLVSASGQSSGKQVAAAFANGFARGMKASVFGAKEILSVSSSRLDPIQETI